MHVLSYLVKSYHGMSRITSDKDLVNDFLKRTSDLSYQEAGDKVGVSRETISRWIDGDFKRLNASTRRALRTFSLQDENRRLGNAIALQLRSRADLQARLGIKSVSDLDALPLGSEPDVLAEHQARLQYMLMHLWSLTEEMQTPQVRETAPDYEGLGVSIPEYRLLREVPRLRYDAFINQLIAAGLSREDVENVGRGVLGPIAGLNTLHQGADRSDGTIENEQSQILDALIPVVLRGLREGTL